MLHALSGNYMEFPRLLYSSGFRPTKIQGASINMRGCKSGRTSCPAHASHRFDWQIEGRHPEKELKEAIFAIA